MSSGKKMILAGKDMREYGIVPERKEGWDSHKPLLRTPRLAVGCRTPPPEQYRWGERKNPETAGAIVQEANDASISMAVMVTPRAILGLRGRDATGRRLRLTPETYFRRTNIKSITGMRRVDRWRPAPRRTASRMPRKLVRGQSGFLKSVEWSL